MTNPPSSDSDDNVLDPTRDRPATSRARPTPPGMWQPPSLEEMQGMLPQYQFECLLGHGGMGAVFKAVQVSLDRAVAVKVLPGDLLGDTDAQFMERFKNEARTMAKMNHPAIVDVHDFGVTQTGLLYFVMEFIDGTDVSKMIIASGCLPPEHALAITAHVCDALEYAHTHGVIHRDIKPANVLINMEGQVKVADFGLAKASDPNHIGLTRTNMAMGTPDFVAPEATINGIQLDRRADIYAVGVMLYQMLTGNIPRGMWTMPSVMVQTDPRFDAIIGRAMQVDREARYQTALDMRRDLDVILTVPYVTHDDRHSSAAIPKQQLALAHQQQQVMVHRPPQKSARLPQRQPQRVVTYAPQKKGSGLLGLVAAVIVGGAGLFYFQKMQKPAAPPPAAPAAGVTSAPIKVADDDATSAAQSESTLSKPAPSVPLAAALPTPAGVLSFGGHRYQFVPDKTLTWTQAKAAAEKLGGHLATITSKEENDWIASTVIAKLERGLGAWIGGTSEGTPGKWRWITGEPFTFTAWGGSEPQNTSNEPVMLFIHTDYGTLAWADIKDDATHSRNRRAGYLVEWDQDTAPVLAGGEVAGPPMDLLASVDVKRDAVLNTWELKPDGLLATPKSGSAQVLEFNLTPPEEYDFTIEFTIKSGNREIIQIIPVPTGSIVFQMGPFSADPAAYGFGPKLDGVSTESTTRTEAITKLPRLKTGQRYHCVVEVRKETLRAVLDGHEIVKWSGNFARLKNDAWPKVRDPLHPGVAAYNTTVTFHKAELRPQNIVFIRLAEFESQFKEAWERDVTRSTAGKAIAALDTQYLAALDRALADATKAGSLDDVTALNAEKKRVADQAPLPAADPASIPASLRRLRATYRKTVAPLISQRDAAADPVYARYDAALAAFETELAQKSALADAQRVRARRAEIELLRRPEKKGAMANVAATPAAAPKPAARPSQLTEAMLKETPPKPFTPEEAIKWALSLNGSATILKGREESQVLGPATMPKGKYTLVGLKIGERQTLRIVDLAGLANLADLRELVLDLNLITDDGLAFLPPLPKLDKLGLHECGLTDASFTHLSKQRALTRLSIGNNKITGEGIGFFSGVAALKSLSIGSSSLTSEGMRNLTRCTALTTLDLSGCGTSKCASLAPLSAIAPLRSLRMVNDTTDALVQSLATVTQIESLDLSVSPITDAAFDRVSSMSSLSDLTLYDCKNLTDAGYLKLLPLGKTFTRLIPTRTKLSDAAFTALAKEMPMMAEIDLSYTGVSPAGLAGLENFKKLKSLGVHAQQCTEEGLKHLSRATNNLNLATFGIRDIETLDKKQQDAVRRSLTRYSF